jgi:DNA-binding NarL/FixJ family response regulator
MPTEEKGRKRQTTTPERVQIIEKHAAGESVHLIAKELDISKSGAQKIVHDWKDSHRTTHWETSKAYRE